MGNYSDTADLERRFKPRKGKYAARKSLLGLRRDGMYTIGGILTLGMLNQPDMNRGPYRPNLKGYWDAYQHVKSFPLTQQSN